MRKREDSLIKIQRKLGISWSKTKKLEGYRLLDLRWERESIAKELGVNVSTISGWRVLQKSWRVPKCLVAGKRFNMPILELALIAHLQMAKIKQIRSMENQKLTTTLVRKLLIL